MRARTLLGAAVALLLTAAPEGAAMGLDVKQQYEENLLRWALAKTGLERDPSPAGKIIERVEIVREEIIARSDPWPGFLNIFHAKTRDYIVRQELLIGPGERWDDERIDESARNLRKLYILAVVRTQACRSREPGKVVLLVVTKDLWSIRLNMNWSLVGSVVGFWDFTPTEMNLAGRNKRLSLHLRLEELDLESFKVRDAVSVGQLYVDPRVLGSRLRFVEYVDLVVAGEVPSGGVGLGGKPWVPSVRPGAIEGAYAQVTLGKPLFSLATEWAWGAWGVLDMRQVRRYTVNPANAPPGESPGHGLKTLLVQSPLGTLACKVNGAPSTCHAVPRVYDREELLAGAYITRSFGRAIKHDVSAGLTSYRLRYAPPDDFPFDEQTRKGYVAALLPRSEDASYFYITYQTRDTRFIQLRNIQTFALTEDFSLGHSLSLTARFATNLTDSTQGYGELSASASYLWHWRGDLLTVWATASSRYQPRIEALGYPGPLVSSSLDVGFKNITPRLWIGRLHVQLHATLRDNNIDNTTIALGGDSGLRGYASGQFEGQNLLLVNAEYRSEPLNLFTVHCGFILFYDGGAVYAGPDPRQPSAALPFRFHQSVGLGLRAHLPQFDKESMRVDFGVPLSGDAGGVGTWISFSFRQAF
jgi:hypothetical protein